MNKLLIPFSGIKQEWLRENLSVLPLLLVISVIYVSVQAVAMSLLYPMNIDVLLLYIYYSFVIFIVPLSVINALYITRKWVLKKLNFSLKSITILFLSLCAGLIIGGAVMQLVHELTVGVDPYNGQISTLKAQVINFEIGLIVGLPLLIIYLRKEWTEHRLKQHELNLIKLEQLQSQAELEALQAKINPHFLYNSLNSIASLIYLDADKAEQMVVSLSRFFRYSINSQDEYFATVEKELEIVETYLEIEKIRFGDKLLISYEIDPEAMGYQIPRFMLQPLVENAIKHGISKILETGMLNIRIEISDDCLEIMVRDNGPDFPEDFISGYGLRNIYEKLDLLMKDNYEINLMNGKIKAVQVTLNKPHKKWPLPSELLLSKTKSLPEIV